MHLVHNGLRERPAQWQVAFPAVAPVIGDYALAGVRMVAAAAGCSAAPVVARHGDDQAVGVQQHLAGIEAHTEFGRLRAVGMPGAVLTGPQPGSVDVPAGLASMEARIGRDHALGCGLLGAVVEQQAQALRAAGEDVESDALEQRYRAQRARASRRW